MKIFYDNLIFSKELNGGISNYWYELVRHFSEENNQNISFFEDSNINSNFHRKQLSFSEEKLLKIYPKNDLQSRLFPISSFKSNEKFIYHSSYYRALKNCTNQIEVTTIHDFTHNYFAPFINKSIHNYLKYNAIKRSKGIICISNHTYKDLLKFCPPQNKQKIAIIYQGVSDDYKPLFNKTFSAYEILKNNQLTEPFFLYVGSRLGYKNFDFVVEFMKTTDKKLVVVGSAFTNRELKKAPPEVHKKIVLLSDVSNKELNILYNFAEVLLYPSYYEGFGIPVIEAMRAGCVVVAYNGSSVAEITEGNGILLNSLHTSFLNAELLKIKNQSHKQELIEKGFEISKKYSWDKCFAETKQFYEDLW